MKQLTLNKIKMIHIAIMKKSWGLLPRILSGQKIIESRWYMNKYRPWNNIEKNDTVYFKDSGEPVAIKCQVKKVLQFENLSPQKVKKIINQYGGADGLGIRDKKRFIKLFKNKKYCLLVFLKDPQKIKPFEINKSGFGNMSAWITIDDISRIKI